MTALRKRLADFVGYDAAWWLDWHPDEDIAQAMMVAEKIGDLCIVRNDTQTIVKFHKNVCITRLGSMKNIKLEAVISEAADSWLRQVGGDDGAINNRLDDRDDS